MREERGHLGEGVSALLGATLGRDKRVLSCPGCWAGEALSSRDTEPHQGPVGFREGSWKASN